MNGYQPKKTCDDCLVFDHCSRSKKQKAACKKYEAMQPSPPKSGSCVTPAFRKTVPMPEVKPAKQRTVLSVRDFAILYELVKRELNKCGNLSEAKESSWCQDLLRIRDKLGELNIDVETPIVEVEE